MTSSWGGRDKKHLPLDQPGEFERLPERKKRRMLEWIETCFEKAPNTPGTTSYGMKHWMEDEIGLYVTNGAFKGAMLQAGYAPVDTSMLNWQFRCRWKPPCEALTVRGHPCKRRRLPREKQCSVHHYLHL